MRGRDDTRLYLSIAVDRQSFAVLAKMLMLNSVCPPFGDEYTVFSIYYPLSPREEG